MDLSQFPIVVKILGILAVVNVVATAAKQVLDKVASGSKADTIIGKICGMLSWILSHVTANTQTPAPAPVAAAPAAQAPAAQPDQTPTK